MQRILYLTDSLIVGGTERQLVALIARLDRRRFEPYVICLYGERAGPVPILLNDLSGVPVIMLDLGWGAVDKLRGVIGIVRAVWCIRPQIVQAVNYHGNLLLRLARLFLPLSVKLIGCVYVEYTPKQLRYERLSAWMCSVMICNSQPIRQQLANCLSPNRIHVIPNGIDLERFAPVSRLSGGRVLLFMGRIARQKAPHIIVEALGLLKRRGQLPARTALWIVGESQESEAQSLLDDAVRRNDLAAYVTQFSVTVRPELYFQVADVLVLPSLWEGLPNVVLEALAVGCPVIVSEVANAAGVVQHGINGWVVPTADVEVWADVLGDVLALSVVGLEFMWDVCRRSALPFSVEMMVHQYEAVYECLSARS